MDIAQALKVLSGNVFAGQQACIRELIANAADSISQLPQDDRTKPEIRLIPNRLDATLSVSDNGIGMTQAEATRLLGTLFATNKSGRTELIGQFGIGFYASFPLCSKVEVLTRTRRRDDPGTLILYAGGHTLRVVRERVESPGTTVRLHVLEPHRSLLRDDTLLSLIAKDCEFVPYPVFLGTSQSALNRMDAPWYHDRPEGQLREALREFYGVRDPLVTIPVRGNVGRGRVQGLLYIASSHMKPALRLYSRRVLVAESEKSLLDERLGKFLSGVLDAEDLPLVLSRNAIIENSPQAKELRTLVVSHLGQGLVDLARTRNKEFRRLMAEHGPSVKAACLEHECLLTSLRDWLPYRSSLHGYVTVPEYLRRKGDSLVIYADDESVGESLLPLYNQANLEVLFMTDAVDLALRRDWHYQGEEIEFTRLDEDPPSTGNTTSASTTPGVDRSSIEAVRQLFRSAVEEDLLIEVRALGPDSPPALLALSDEDRQHLQVVELVRMAEKKGAMAELPAELQRLAKTGFLDLLSTLTTKTVILNQSNDVVLALMKRLGRGGFSRSEGGIEILLAEFLYGQALMSSGLHLSPEKLAEVTQSQTKLVASMLRQLR